MATTDFTDGTTVIQAEWLNIADETIYTPSRNVVLNGDFRVWQAGTSFTSPAADAYNADQWRISYDGSGATRTISRQSFTPGQTDVPAEPQYFLRFNQSVAGSGATITNANNVIEDVRTLAGQDVVLSFYAKSDAALAMPSIVVRQVFGTGGSSSVDTTLQSNVNVTTSWQEFTYTGTLPSITGKTIASDSYLELILYTPINTTFILDIVNVQLRKGTFTPQFETEPFGDVLRRCQRYYVKTFNYDDEPAEGASATSDGAINARADSNGDTLFAWDLPTEMRAEPSITIYSPSTSGFSGQAWNVDDSTSTPASVSVHTGTGRVIMVTATDATDANDRMAVHVVANARF